MTRHPSTDSTPSDSGSSPSDSGSSPSPSTPQKLLPACSSPFGPRLFHATPSSSGTPRPQPEGSDHRNNNKTPRLSGMLGGHGPCGRYVPVKMERIKVCIMFVQVCLQFNSRCTSVLYAYELVDVHTYDVYTLYYSQVLTGSEVESDYQEPQTIDTRVVMGQETLLKTTEIQTGKLLVDPSCETIPAVPCFSDPQAHAKETQLESSKEENQVQSPQKKQETLNKPEQTPTTLPSPFHKPPFTPSSSPQPVKTDNNLIDNQEEGQTLSQDEVPSLPFSELACPVALSFSEPAYAVDPLRVGVPSSLDPDLYYTAPSTPIKMTSRSSHLKHHSYPGSPVCPLSPGSPSDSEDLCSPLTSPSGSYITAEGGSLASSYTSSTSPSTSPNLLLTEEAQEAPACFVGSLSEIGDEVGEEKVRVGPEQVEERTGDFCMYRPEEFVMNSQTGTVIHEEEEESLKGEEEESLKGDEIKISRESCRSCWVTEDTSPLRSSSSRSSDSQEDGGESESSLCPLEEASARRAEYSRPIQTCLKLQLEACISEEHYGRMDDHPELPSTALTPDIENMTLTSSSLSPDSPLTPLDAFCPGAFDRLGLSSFMFSQAACADDIPDEERMIPASLISFPLHTSLIFKADSMEITLFPTEEENEIGEVNDGNEGKDVDAYAAGEEEADVEDDDDDDEEEDDDYDYEDDGDDNTNGAAEGNDKNNDNSDNHDETGEEAKVEVKVVEEEDDEECDSKAVEDPTDEDSSASFLHSLSETSINEGLDESFCFQDDTDDSLDSASYNGEEDERLYSTERHAQSLEPTSVDALDLTETQSEPQRRFSIGTTQTEPLHTDFSTDKLVDDPKPFSFSKAIAAHSAGSNIEPSPLDVPKTPEPQSSPEVESKNAIDQTKPLHMQVSTDKTCTLEAVSCQPESFSNLNDSGTESEMMDSSHFSNPLQQHQESCFHFRLSAIPVEASLDTAAEFHISTSSDTSTRDTTDLNCSILPEELAEEHSQIKDADLKQSTDDSGEEEPERDSFKLLIKPCHYQPESHKTVGATRLVLTKSFSNKSDMPAGAEAICGSSTQREFDIELDQKNGNFSPKSMNAECRGTDCGPSLNMSTATNDLNKGVLLLSCPKDTSPNPSNIPVSVSPEVISELADNLALTPEHCASDSAQENLRENTLTTDEGVLGAVGSPQSPFAISPKRENSETETGREIDPGAGAWCGDRMGLGLGSGPEFGVWGAGESLSLSLGKGYELEAESLLMCDTDGQSSQTTMVPNMTSEVFKNYDNVLGSVLDEEDNNSLCGKRDQMADEELVEERASESNLACWKSIEEISEAGGGEDGSSRFPEDDVSNLNHDNDRDTTDTQIQDTWKNSNNNNDSGFDPLEVAMCGSLNALSEEVRPQSVSASVRESVSNIPLEEMPAQVSDKIADEQQEPTDRANQTSDTNQEPSSKEGTSSISIPLVGTHTDATNKAFSPPDKAEVRYYTSTECQAITPESSTAFSLLHGSFGSFTPKCKSKESRLSKVCQVEKNGSPSEQEMGEPQTEVQNTGDMSPITDIFDEPKTKNAIRGQQSPFCNSGEEGEGEKVEKKAEKTGEENDRNNKKERKTSSPQNSPEHFVSCTPKEELCTDKPIAAKKGRRGKQNKRRTSQAGSHADSSPECADDPKKPSLPVNITADRWSKENAANSTTKTGQKSRHKASSPDCPKRTSKSESCSQRQRDNSPSPDVKSPSHGYCNSTTHTPDNLNVVVEMNQELHEKLKVLDNRPLPDSQRGITVDINDNNIVTGSRPNQDGISCTPLSLSAFPVSSSSPLPCASVKPEDDLSTPVQESQPVFLAQQKSSLSMCHTTPTLCSTSPTTQKAPNSQLLPNNNPQEATVTHPTSTSSTTSVSLPTFSTAMPLSLSQPTQESSAPESENLESACVVDSIFHPRSQFCSQSQPNLNAQAHKQIQQGCTWNTQDRCRGEYRKCAVLD